MWIIHPKLGMASVVEDATKQNHVLLRFRELDHASRWKRAVGFRGYIMVTPHADYRWKFSLSKTRWSNALSRLEWDYRNVKDCAHSHLSADFLYDVMHPVWKLGYEHQSRQVRKTSP